MFFEPQGLCEMKCEMNQDKGTSCHCLLCLCFWKRFPHSSVVSAQRMFVFTLCLFLWSWLSSIHSLEFRYHNSVEMGQYLKDINEKFPDITHLHSIGQSVEGKPDLVQRAIVTIFSYIYHLWVGCMCSCRRAQCYTEGRHRVTHACSRFKLIASPSIRELIVQQIFLWVYKKQQEYSEPNTAASWASASVGERKKNTDLGGVNLCIYLFIHA